MSYANLLPLLKSYDALIIANGVQPKTSLLNLFRQCSGKLIALDGGVDTLMKKKIAPDFVIGDFDSASAGALEWARKNGATLIRKPSQEEPDFVKGLALCSKLKFKSVVVVSADGDRLDHTLSSLYAAAKQPKLDLVFLTAGALVFPLSGRVSRAFRVPENHPLSWIPLSEARGCTFDGVKWPFRRRTLRIGGFLSLSNLPSAPEVRLSQQSGNSLLIVALTPQPETTSSSRQF